jgi:hypothetical protein
MNELKELEHFRAAVAPPDSGTLTRARSQMLSQRGLIRRAGPVRSHERGRQVGRLAGIAAVTAGAAVAITVTLVTSLSSAPSSEPRPVASGGVSLDAKIVLERAAAAYLKLPAPRGDQYLYSTVSVTGNGGPAVQLRSWMSANGSRPSVQGEFPCRQIPDPARFSSKLRRYFDSCLSSVAAVPGPRAETTYSGMQTLPAQPAALLAYLAQHNECRGFTPADGEWAQVTGIFQLNPVVPPAFGAALLRAAARIPGVRVLPRVSLAGGTYVGVVRTLPPGIGDEDWMRTALIFDPYTYKLVGSLRSWSDHPIPDGTGDGSGDWLVSSVLVQAGVVNSAPVIPSGLHLAQTVPGPPLSCGLT